MPSVTMWQRFGELWMQGDRVVSDPYGRLTDVREKRSDMWKFVASLSAVALLIGCSSSSSSSDSTESAAVDGSEPPNTYVEYEPTSLRQLLTDTDLYSIFAELSALSDYAPLFEADGEITLFLPVNKAFETIPPETIEKLKDPANKEILNRIVGYHIMEGNVPEATIVSGPLLMLSGDNAEADVGPMPGYMMNMMVNGSQVIVGDMVAGRSVAHLIAEVLIPYDLDLSTL